MHSRSSPILYHIDSEVLALSEVFGATVNAFLAQDPQAFIARRSTYIQKLRCYFELMHDGLYWPLKHMLECDDARIKLNEFEEETLDFQSRLSGCLEIFQNIGVEASSGYDGDIYYIDRTITNQHLKEKEFLYPLHEENTWLVLNLDRGQNCYM